jgi:hypothetical protein
MNYLTVSDSTLDASVMDIDKNYRNKFCPLILEAKKQTHKCQFECYSNKDNITLELGENCARKCFAPMLQIKKNISKLVENCKENLEKCKANSVSKSNSSKYDSHKIYKCLENYEKDLENTRDESEYIYVGYMKNFDELIKEASKTKI